MASVKESHLPSSRFTLCCEDRSGKQTLLRNLEHGKFRMTLKSAAVLFTGGKDSTYTIDLLQDLGYRIDCLITMLSENEDSYMLHTASIEVADRCSKALAIPIFFGRTKGQKEAELPDIMNTIKSARDKFGFDNLGSGGIASLYQADRIERIAKEVGVNSIAPLWGANQLTYLRELVSKGYRFIMTSVSAEGLEKGWLGKEISMNDVSELSRLSNKYGFNVAFEGGEAETLVLDCPLYEAFSLEIKDSEIEWHSNYGRLRIKRIELTPKKKIS